MYTLEQIRQYLSDVADNPSNVPDDVMRVFTYEGVADYLPAVADFRLTPRGKVLLSYREDVQFDIWMRLLVLCNEQG